MDDNRLSRFVAQLGGKLGVAVCVVGFVLIFLGWNGAASFDDLRKQFPYLISGGLAGLALVVVGAALLLVETMRAERSELQASIDDLRRSIETMAGASTAATSVTVPADLVIAGRSSYHRPDCRLVEGRAERLNPITLDDAEEQGLAPCRICNPA